ncbi:MAG: YajQ family cyclic di-GMP-binding protein [Proteobacteria bacterium]|jgi:hypothetical protein|uniref:Uncharacterized protein n=1 Tax=marine metagenome TaxID=408172 RepID=A0A382CCY5_9ZZZZ|nr:YajQ family cyclic di-GMP-binding protein [Pseudomonadota bacterium]MBP08835.1 YajQ family cyclic di-GMP-binding protein [Acidiferrobacteraceae bacterium]MDP6137595.1 YajQ family cyclic di-GMP-binding protein [Arenicellales bacterium]HCF72987.1 YajQ family cyclic di-GMP-binding protein [Gammaproteobacteria bacterium]HJP08396.1 YajQ family cyclic di-GMP-binding protein [Arenicellales bacterium]|tara:strand:+ start:179 stop:664 length:486 start_codon:yes stop_codon:yes gene_type:complete
MPTFDVVSQVDWHEVRNAVDQVNREVSNRFDFKGSDARVEQAESLLTIYADDDFKIGQITDILDMRLAKRGIDVTCLQPDEVVERGAGKVRQEIRIRHGIESELAKTLVKKIKKEKLKVQAAVQGDQLRVSGKKRDDLQAVIALLKNEDIGLPLQYVNFRD